MAQFEGKVAFVTGAGSGIGAATAKLLAERGAAVALVGNLDGPLQDVHQAITKASGKSVTIVADVGSFEEMASAVNRTIEAFGALHLAANCAGVSCAAQPVGETDLANWRTVNAINLDGTFHAMRHQLPAMLASGGGAIVNVASMFAHRGLPLRSGYTASKHGVVGLTRTAALEYARQNIRVNVVAPGVTDTPMLDADRAFVEAQAKTIPIGRMARAEELAKAIAFLLSEEASYITGTTLCVDGGILS